MKKEYIKEIIATQQGRLNLPDRFVPRRQFAQVEGTIKLPHSVVVMGIRRCGKSTLLTQLMKQYYSDQFYYLNFEDERLLSFTAQDFSVLHEALVERFGERKVFYFDELQNVDRWEAYVRRMQESGYKFFITGSNSSMLSKEMGTKLTGRHVDIELFPYSFTEYLSYLGEQTKQFDLYDPKDRGRLHKHFNHYLKKGGMPEYVAYDDPIILESMYEDILFRDIIVRHEIKEIKALRELSMYFMSNAACVFSYNRLKNTLNLGSVNTVKNYVSYLEDAYLISTINQFSYSVKQQIHMGKKSYVIDNGLANAVSFQFSKNEGKFLENLVYMALKRQSKDIFYYKTQNNLEVDFVIREGREIADLIQVSDNIQDEKTRKREITALSVAMDETGLDKGLLLTRDESDRVKINRKEILVKPIYQWLLEGGL